MEQRGQKKADLFGSVCVASAALDSCFSRLESDLSHQFVNIFCHSNYCSQKRFSISEAISDIMVYNSLFHAHHNSSNYIQYYLDH